jgi:hypothetical protein
MKKEYDFSKGKRGAIEPILPGKIRITIRLDNKIIEWFRNKVEEKGGGNYQSMINSALRDYIDRGVENLEAIVRRVIREEINVEVFKFVSTETALNDKIRPDISGAKIEDCAATPPIATLTSQYPIN